MRCMCLTIPLAVGALLGGCAQPDRSAHPLLSEVRIAVPATASADATIVWYRTQHNVRLLDGPVVMQATAHQILVDGIWGVAYKMDETQRRRVQDAVRDHGEAWLVFEGRPFTWNDGLVASGATFMNWSSLTEETAAELARRVSRSGR